MTAIAFEGCSCRAAFHIGVAGWFAERGQRWSAVTGASSGSLVAAAVARDHLDVLWDGWQGSLNVTRVFRPERVWSGRWPLAMSHILRPALERRFGELTMSDTNTPLGIPVTVLGRLGPRIQLLTAKDDVRLADAIAASSFIPGIYSRPVPIGGRIAFDGAWLERCPVRAALDLGDRKAVAVITKSAGQLLGRLRKPRVLPIPHGIRVLAPPNELALHGFDFDRERTLDAHRIGRQSAERFARQNEDWL